MLITLLSITDLVGHLHPVLVHLPIGILLMAAMMQWLSARDKYVQLQGAIAITYLTGCLAAILSCISGWVLASGGGYDEDTLSLHRWMGISVAVVSTIGYYYARKGYSGWQKWIALLLFLLIIVTGHFGGTLTHGEGYLTKGLSGTKDTLAVLKPIPNAQEAVVYTDIIQPMLQTKCVGCHGATKQKGDLRLDGKEGIMKGGHDGVDIKAGNPEASELYKRIILDPLEEKHMAPKGKPQLSERDRLLIHWWIATGANFTARSKELPQPVAVKTALTSLEQQVIKAVSDVPLAVVGAADDSVLVALHKAGLTILPVSVGSNYLTANLVTVHELKPEWLTKLLAVKEQLIWLKMPGIQLPDSAWKQIGGLVHLTKLSIEHANITDQSLSNIANLLHLQYLNLVDTKVSVDGLLKLKGLSELRELFVGQTKLSKEELAILQKSVPKTNINTGGYDVPVLRTDTELLKAPPVKK